MPARSMPFVRLLSTAVLLAPLLAACGETVAPESDESALQHAAPGSSDGGGAAGPRPDCLFSVLFTVRGDEFSVAGFTMHDLDQPQSSGGSCGKGAANRIGTCERLDADGGFAQLWWDLQLVGEVDLDDAFLRAGAPAVLAHDTPEGVRYEYHIFTKQQCDTLPGFTLTREQVAAFER